MGARCQWELIESKSLVSMVYISMNIYKTEQFHRIVLKVHIIETINA